MHELRPKTTQLYEKESSKEVSWLDKLNFNIESLHDVDSYLTSTKLVQDTSHYVESSVTNLGSNVQRLYGSFVRELFSPLPEEQTDSDRSSSLTRERSNFQAVPEFKVSEITSRRNSTVSSMASKGNGNAAEKKPKRQLNAVRLHSKSRFELVPVVRAVPLEKEPFETEKKTEEAELQPKKTSVPPMPTDSTVSVSAAPEQNVAVARIEPLTESKREESESICEMGLPEEVPMVVPEERSTESYQEGPSEGDQMQEDARSDNGEDIPEILDGPVRAGSRRAAIVESCDSTSMENWMASNISSGYSCEDTDQEAMWYTPPKLGPESGSLELPGTDLEWEWEFL